MTIGKNVRWLPPGVCSARPLSASDALARPHVGRPTARAPASMTKGVRLSSATDWRCDRAVVAASHLHVTPQASRPVTPSSLIGLSHNMLAQRTQSREAGPPKWRSASPRQAHLVQAIPREWDENLDIFSAEHG